MLNGWYPVWLLWTQWFNSIQKGNTFLFLVEPNQATEWVLSSEYQQKCAKIGQTLPFPISRLLKSNNDLQFLSKIDFDPFVPHHLRKEKNISTSEKLFHEATQTQRMVNVRTRMVVVAFNWTQLKPLCMSTLTRILKRPALLVANQCDQIWFFLLFGRLFKA